MMRQEAAPKVVLRRANEVAPEYVTLHVPEDVFQALLPGDASLYTDTLRIVTNLYSVEDQVLVDVQRDHPPVLSAPVLPIQPLVQEALERYPFMITSETPASPRTDRSTLAAQSAHSISGTEKAAFLPSGSTA